MGKAIIKTLEGPKWAYTRHATTTYRSVTKTSLRKNPKKPKALRGRP